MLGHSMRARPPRGDPAAVSVGRDPSLVASFLSDAAHFPGGHAPAIATPSTEAAIADILKMSSAVLAIGAQSSLTGGATPMGETLLRTSRFNRVLEIGDDWARVQAGVTLTDLDTSLHRAGKYYPPAPTFMGAFIGGTVATNAAGAATFKYGTTRDWVRALTVVLPKGDVLEITRGAARAHPDGWFELALSDGIVRVPVPKYRMPGVAKVSAGYYAAPEMDLIDLFIGSEGTLGIVTEVTLSVLPLRPAMCLAFVPFSSRSAALAFVKTLREAGDLDVSAIEHMDRRCLQLLHEDGADARFGVSIPDRAAIALLITLELPAGMTAERAFDEIGRARELGPPDTPLIRFCRALDEAPTLDAVEIAVPGDDARAAQLLGVREAVPAAVNARVGRAQQAIDARIAKTAADMIVPFDRVEELMEIYDAEFARRGLDGAVWGHISDGNLHPNVIPRSMGDVESGNDAIREFSRQVIRLGGSPLAEHGVGRNPIKQQLLQDLYGQSGIDQMRATKRALDPDYKLAPGVLFSKA